jgi:hypothetical protein
MEQVTHEVNPLSPENECASTKETKKKKTFLADFKKRLKIIF